MVLSMKVNKGEILEKYTSSPRVMVISLGKWDGFLTYKNVAIHLVGSISGTQIASKAIGLHMLTSLKRGSALNKAACSPFL